MQSECTHRVPVSLALLEQLAGREEIHADRTDMPLFDERALFQGWDTSGAACISIGPQGGEEPLRIGVVPLSDEPDSMVNALLVKVTGANSRIIKVEFRDSVELLPPGSHTLPPEPMRLPTASVNEVSPDYLSTS